MCAEIRHECTLATNAIAGGERPFEDGSAHGVRAFLLIAAPARAARVVTLRLEASMRVAASTGCKWPVAAAAMPRVL